MVAFVLLTVPSGKKHGTAVVCLLWRVDSHSNACHNLTWTSSLEDKPLRQRSLFKRKRASNGEEKVYCSLKTWSLRNSQARRTSSLEDKPLRQRSLFKRKRASNGEEKVYCSWKTWTERSLRNSQARRTSSLEDKPLRQRSLFKRKRASNGEEKVYCSWNTWTERSLRNSQARKTPPMRRNGGWFRLKVRTTEWFRNCFVQTRFWCLSVATVTLPEKSNL